MSRTPPKTPSKPFNHQHRAGNFNPTQLDYPEAGSAAADPVQETDVDALFLLAQEAEARAEQEAAQRAAQEAEARAEQEAAQRATQEAELRAEREAAAARRLQRNRGITTDQRFTPYQRNEDEDKENSNPEYTIAPSRELQQLTRGIRGHNTGRRTRHLR